MTFSGYFHFANPFFYLAAPVVQVNLEKRHAAGLLHPAIAFVCMNTHVMDGMDALAMK